MVFCAARLQRGWQALCGEHVGNMLGASATSSSGTPAATPRNSACFKALTRCVGGQGLVLVSTFQLNLSLSRFVTVSSL